MQTLHDYISSDHSPLVVNISCSQLPELCEVKSNSNTHIINKVDWNKLSQILKYEYSVKTKQLLVKISLSRDAIQCHDPVCSNAPHKSKIKDFYDAVINVLLTASAPLRNSFKSQRSGLHVPGWRNSDVKQAHSIARQNYLKWIDNGKPHSGNLYQQMSNSRKIFKSKL